jgi:predicted MPP superfamily phosphohydrolase
MKRFHFRVRVLAGAWLAAIVVGLAAQGPPPGLPAGAPAGPPPQGAPPAGRPQGPGGAGPGRGAAPLTVPQGGFFFVQLSDTQFGFSNNDIDFIQDTVNAEFAIATVNRLKPAFVVVTGDLINKPGDAAQNAEYQRIMAKLDKAIPLYNISGNHDIENEPTAAALAHYRKLYGRDYYTFRHGSLLGIVLNSTVIHSPQHVPNELAEQDTWLRAEVERAKSSGAKHVIVFQHHPWFLEKADEADQYFNIPLARRTPLLDLFRASGIQYLVSGHLHRSTEATDGGLTTVVTGPVGRPLGGQSGFRIFVVTETDVTHRYYGLGEMPYRIGPPMARGQGAGRGAPPAGRGAPPPAPQ